MKYLVTMLFLLPYLAAAELVKGPAFVWDDNKRTHVIRLEDSVSVEADSKNGQWYRIAFHFKALASDFLEDGTLKKGAVLMNLAGKRIGVTLADLQVPTYDTQQGLTEAVVGAIQINKRNIYPDSDIDSRFKSILAHNKFQLSDFQDHFARNSYQVWIDSASYKTFILTGASVEFSPVIRLLAVFDKSRLFCVIHYGNLDFPKVRSTSSVREFHVTYFGPDKKSIDKFESIYFPIIKAAD